MWTLYRTPPFDQLFRIRVPKPTAEENIERERANEKFFGRARPDEDKPQPVPKEIFDAAENPHAML